MSVPHDGGGQITQNAGNCDEEEREFIRFGQSTRFWENTSAERKKKYNEHVTITVFMDSVQKIRLKVPRFKKLIIWIIRQQIYFETVMTDVTEYH